MSAEPKRLPEGVCALVINYNTGAHTLRCVQSLCQAGVRKILVLDNASREADRDQLQHGLLPLGDSVYYIQSDVNLGFSAGSNLLIHVGLSMRDVQAFFLLNSDAVLVATGYRSLLEEWLRSGASMLGGRMHRPQPGVPLDAQEVESMGIAMYRSLLASNRKSLDDRFLGPTGGCAIYSRTLVETLLRDHGYVFDPDYFCYAEDTDLCLRARLLGFDAVYVDRLIATHEGQVSSAGNRDFILYYGIRNSIWTVVKSVPLGIIIANLHRLFVIHIGVVFLHAHQGRMKTIWRLYRDAIIGIPAQLKKRKVIMAGSKGAYKRVSAFVSPRLYDSGYLKAAVFDLVSGSLKWPRRGRQAKK